MKLPDGFHADVADGGQDRPEHVCENAAEVRARFDPNPQPVVECAWCGSKFKTMNAEKAVAWFLLHPCESRGSEYHWIGSADEARAFGRQIASNERKAEILACAHCGQSTRVARTAEQAVAWFEGHQCADSVEEAA